MQNFLEPADYHHALSSFSRPDFSEVAAFYILDGDKNVADLSGDNRLQLDLIINNVVVPQQEFNKVDQHIGDTFSVHFFGRAPLIINVGGILIDTVGNYNKDYLLGLYLEKLRMKAVARTGIMPVLQMPGIAFSGALLNLNIMESAETIDHLQVTFAMLVFKMTTFSPQNSGATDNDIDFTKNIFSKAAETSAESSLTQSTGASLGANSFTTPSLFSSFIQPMQQKVGSVVTEIAGSKLAMDFGNIAYPNLGASDRMFNGLTGFMGYGEKDAAALAVKYTDTKQLSSIENAIINDAIITKQMSPYASSITGGSSYGNVLGTLKGKGMIDSVTGTCSSYLKSITKSMNNPLGDVLASSIPELRGVVKSGLNQALVNIPGVKELYGYMDQADAYLDSVDKILSGVVNLPNTVLRQLNGTIRNGAEGLLKNMPDGIVKNVARSAINTGVQATTGTINQYYRNTIGGQLRDVNKIRGEFRYWYKDILQTPNNSADTEAAVERYKRKVISSSTNKATTIATSTVKDVINKGVSSTKTTSTKKKSSSSKISKGISMPKLF